MNAFERMMAALSHMEADRVPVYPILAGATRTLVGADYRTWATDAKVCAEAYKRAVERFDLDCVLTLIDLSVECEAWGQKLIYPENEAAHPDYAHPVVCEPEDYEKIRYIDYRTGTRMMMHLDVVKRLAETFKGKVPIISFVFGPLGTLSMLRNQQELYIDLYDEPEAVKQAVQNVAHTLSDYAGALCDAGADAIMWDTLFASGSVMSKDMWNAFEREPMQMLSENVRRHGCMNMIHNCGQNIYFDVQIDAIQPSAISFLYPPDDCATFSECKQKYGDKVTLIGCVPPTNAAFGTDREWDKLCFEQIDTMAKGGGFVLATGCEYPANADLLRAERMIEIAKSYGAYRHA